MRTATTRTGSRTRTVLSLLEPGEALVLPFLVLLALLAVARPSAVGHPDSRSALAASAVLAALWCAAAAWCPVWHGRRSRLTKHARGLLALALCLLLYPSLRWAVPMLHPARYDAALARADRWLFGGRDPLTMVEPLMHPTLTAALCWVYFCLWVPPLSLAVVLAVRGRHRELSDLVLALTLGHCAGFAGYFLLPAIGPWYELADRFTVSIDGNWWIAHYRAHNNNVDAFPSLHIATTTLVGLLAWRDCRPLLWLLSPLLVAIGLSTLYLRWHYVVDVLAGLALAAAVRLLAPRLNAAWPRTRAVLPRPAKAPARHGVPL